LTLRKEVGFYRTEMRPVLGGRVMRLRALVILRGILAGSALVLACSAYAQETLTVSTVISNGMNLTGANAQTIDDSAPTNQPLFNTALGAFDAKNSDTVLQNPSSFTTGGQMVSPQFFPYLSSSVPVNSNLAVLGALAASGAASTNYFGFDETVGADISLFATATHPSGQGTELLLYDNNGNLVAIASGNAADALSSIIDYAVPSGGAGKWVAAVAPSGGSPIDYRLELALPFTAISEFTTNVVGNGEEKNGSLGAYDVSANVGDRLSFDVHSTSPADSSTELLLYDNNGNLVAIASGNGADALSSIIDYTVPSGGGGDWQIDVAPDGAYAYDLAIQGASGLGPVNPLGTPVPGPSTWVITFVGFAGLGLLRLRSAGRERLRFTSARL
jgi:hypothetical protein